MTEKAALTRAEIIRLNALDRALGLAPHIIRTAPSIQTIFSLAEQIETWLKNAKETIS